MTQSSPSALEQQTNPTMRKSDDSLPPLQRLLVEELSDIEEGGRDVELLRSSVTRRKSQLRSRRLDIEVKESWREGWDMQQGFGRKWSPVLSPSAWWVNLGETKGAGASQIPHTRRSHSAAVYRGRPRVIPGAADDSAMQEFMIISGGVARRDWTSFPVWAYDMTEAATTGVGKWYNLTPPPGPDCHGKESPDKGARQMQRRIDSSWESAERCGPSGRLGHISAVHNGYLYVFGGMVSDVDRRVFHTDSEPYMYRLRVDEFLSDPDLWSSEDGPEAPEWQRIMPSIKHPVDTFGEGLSYLSDFNAKDLLIRSEVRGGIWKPDSEHARLLIYGGLRIQSVSSHEDSDQPLRRSVLGDIWSFDFDRLTWEMMAPTNPLPSGEEDDDDDALPFAFPSHPAPRTAHAVTIVGNQMYVFGGMRVIGTEPHGPWSWRSEGTSVGVTSTDWFELEDVWVFEIAERKWRHRSLYPKLKRTFHTLVGWSTEGRGDSEGGATIAAFGGYTAVANPLTGKELGFVFDETVVLDSALVYRDTWLEAIDETESAATVSNRLEHTAVFSEEFGAMFVWGGRFRDTEDTDGVWAICLAAGDSNVVFQLAEPDGLEEYEQTVAALHILVASMVFMAVVFTVACGIISRRRGGGFLVPHGAVDGDPTNGGTLGFEMSAAAALGRRRGLRPEIIETLPLKTFKRPSAAESELQPQTQHDAGTCAGPENAPVSGENVSPVDPCPICLVEYEDGDEVRCLPCNHEFHKGCVDGWLSNNATCPACRYSLRDLAQLGVPSSGVSASAFLSSAFGWSQQLSSRNSGSEDLGSLELTETVGSASTLRPQAPGANNRILPREVARNLFHRSRRRLAAAARRQRGSRGVHARVSVSTPSLSPSSSEHWEDSPEDQYAEEEEAMDLPYNSSLEELNEVRSTDEAEGIVANTTRLSLPKRGLRALRLGRSRVALRPGRVPSRDVVPESDQRRRRKTRKGVGRRAASRLPLSEPLEPSRGMELV